MFFDSGWHILFVTPFCLSMIAFGHVDYLNACKVSVECSIYAYMLGKGKINLLTDIFFATADIYKH
jgi:hypothetical protein